MSPASGDTSIFKKIIQLFKTTRRAPPPRLGDGKYESEETPDSLKGGIIKELSAAKKGIPEDLDIILEFVNLAKAGGYKFDIRQLPDIVFSPPPPCNINVFKIWSLAKLISSLPPGGITQAALIAPLAKLGWESLGHPPISYLGDEFQYRSADGSYNVNARVVSLIPRTSCIRISENQGRYMQRV